MSSEKRDGWVTVPEEPTEKMWSGLARQIVMWMRMSDRTGKGLHEHLERSGIPIQDWLAAEIPKVNHVPPKGTVAVVIYRAMLEARPERHVGGSILPSSDSQILKPIETPFGVLQVRALPELDTHALFRTDERGTSMIAEHANGYSCRELAKRMVAGDPARIRQQVEHIVACGGMARHVIHILDIAQNDR